MSKIYSIFNSDEPLVYLYDDDVEEEEEEEELEEMMNTFPTNYRSAEETERPVLPPSNGTLMSPLHIDIEPVRIHICFILHTHLLQFPTLDNSMRC